MCAGFNDDFAGHRRDGQDAILYANVDRTRPIEYLPHALAATERDATSYTLT